MKRWNSGTPIKMPDFAGKPHVLLSSAFMLLLLAGGVAGCRDDDELTYSELELDEVEPAGPAAVDHLGLNWLVDESGHQILVIDDDGQIVDRYELDGLVHSVEDIEVTETHVYVLTMGGAEPVIVRAGRNDVAPSAWETFSIPADNLDLREVTGLRKNADGVISLELAFGSEHLPLFSADGYLDVPSAPLALPPPPSTDVIFDYSGYLPADSNYVPVGPTRLLDTRQSGQQYVGKLFNTQVIPVTVAGNAGLPQANEIGAVVLNVAVVSPTNAGYLTVYPGVEIPDTSNINFAASENTAGLVIIDPGADGKINLRHVANPGSSYVVVDVLGYFPPTPDLYFPGVPDIHMVQPARVFDSRLVQFGPKLLAGEARRVQIGNLGGIPLDPGAVIANVTAMNPVANGWATVYEDGVSKPLTSNLHYITNTARANLVIIPLSSDGYARISTSHSAHYAGDVLGWFGEGVDFEPRPPLRLVDTRIDPNGELGPIDPITIEAPDLNNMVAIFGNLTAYQPTARGYLQVYLDDEPGTST